MDNKRVIELHTKVSGAQELKRLNGAYEQISKSSKAANDSLHKTRGAVQKSTKAYGNMGHVASNMGYQIQDMAVQMQGGVSVMKSMSQQIPQMLVGFGAFGAAIGVVIALLPTLATVMALATDESESLEDAMEGLAKAMDKIDTGEFVDQFKAANEAQRELMLGARQFALLEAQQALKDAGEAAVNAAEDYEEFVAKAAQAEVAFENTAGQVDGMTAGVMALIAALASNNVEDFASDMGFTAEQMEKIAPLMRQVGDEGYRNADSIAALQDQINKFAETEVTEEMSAYVAALNAAHQAALDLAQAQRQLNNQGSDGSELATPVTRDTRGQEFVDFRANMLELTEMGKQWKEQQKEMWEAPPGLDSRGQEFITMRENMRWLTEEGKKYNEQQKAANEEQKITNQLWADQNPALAAYAEEVDKLNEKKERLIITDEQFAAGLEEQQRILRDGFDAVQAYSDVFSGAMDSFTDDVIQGTDDIGGAFEDMAKKIIAEMAKIAAIKGIASLFAGAGYDGIADSLTASLAKGGVMQNGSVTAFAKGGVVNGPTIFPMAKGAGLMGEAGAEGILPLARNAQGELGVKTDGGGGGVNVTVNNMAQGVSVNAREDSGGITLDVVMAQVAGAVRQGGNDLSNALESSYSLGRGGAAY